MKVGGKPQQTIWLKPGDEATVQIIDQRKLPHEFVIEDLKSLDHAIFAIRDMYVRGAPLIGATAAWGLYLAARGAAGNFDFLEQEAARLRGARPTAINLMWAVDRVMEKIKEGGDPVDIARSEAEAIMAEDIEICRMIGVHGLGLIKEIAAEKGGEPVNILTHCNAGWLATVDWGTATSPLYHAAEVGIPIHIWVDETRPRNQGANLTAWELGEHGMSHTVIVDNAGGHLMQKGMVDMVIVGTDRTARNGDVANKIGTYLKALAAHDNDIPFYVALPSPTIDWTCHNGCRDIPIEERGQEEVSTIQGADEEGMVRSVRITPESSATGNPSFDVTPARLVTGLITERGICEASEAGLLSLFPERG